MKLHKLITRIRRNSLAYQIKSRRRHFDKTNLKELNRVLELTKMKLRKEKQKRIV